MLHVNICHRRLTICVANLKIIYHMVVEFLKCPCLEVGCLITIDENGIIDYNIMPHVHLGFAIHFMYQNIIMVWPAGKFITYMFEMPFIVYQLKATFGIANYSCNKYIFKMNKRCFHSLVIKTRNNVCREEVSGAANKRR